MEETPLAPRSSVSCLAHDLDDIHISRSEDILLSENVNFKSLLLPASILCGLDAARFQRPSPIQLKAIPLLRLGLDLIVQAKSGTGKTMVMGIAALETVKVELKKIQAVIIAPTREIALQIKDFVKTIGSGFEGLKTEVFIGGVSKAEDQKHLVGCHIAIGTPGRLQELVQKKLMCLKWVRLLVLDEADKLMEEELFKQIKNIYIDLPANKQTILCSATFPNPLKEYVTCHMKDPFWVSSEGANRLRGGQCQPHNPVPLVLLGVKHFLKELPYSSNVNKLLHLKLDQVLSILSNVSFTQCLIFSNYKSIAETVCNLLVASGWPAMSIRGQDEQHLRNAALLALKEFRCRVLLSTDVTSRGIDVKGIDLVINLDIPYDSATYLHRAGRAGRFGSVGSVITLSSKGKEMNAFKKILNGIPNVKIFKLPEDLLLNAENNDALEELFLPSETVMNDEVENYVERDVTKDTIAVNLCEYDSSMSTVSKKGRRELLVKDTVDHLANILIRGNPIKKENLNSYDELESMFHRWVSEDCPESDRSLLPKRVPHYDWWTSAEIILFEADRELQQLITLNDRTESQANDINSTTLHEDYSPTNCELNFSISPSSKRKKKQARTRATKSIFPIEGTDITWKWHNNWNLYYFWDASKNCCYYFNPWSRIFYKWESNVFYKWIEESQFYAAWDPESSCFEHDFYLYPDSTMRHLNSPSVQFPLDDNHNQWLLWFLSWNNQMKQMCSYVECLDYFNRMYNHCRRNS